MTYDERRELTSAQVTLNGEPAVIRGARLEFAVVASLTSLAKAEWAWESVARIVARDGKFKG